MVINQFILFSVIISALFVSVFGISHDSANADIRFCYDQVGEGHYCFDKNGNCEIANKDDSEAESPCYEEGEFDILID